MRLPLRTLPSLLAGAALSLSTGFGAPDSVPLPAASSPDQIPVPEAIAHPENAQESPDDTTATNAHRTYLEELRKDDRFPSAASCAQCHAGHYEEWSVSPHAYAMLSPVFNAMHMFSTHRTSGTQGDFCIRCHSPVALQREETIYSSVLLRPPVSQEGVTCIVCHRVDRDYGTANGRPTLQEGNIFAPIYGSSGNANLKAALENSALGLVTTAEESGKQVHTDVLKFPALNQPALCGTCHDVTAPNGFRLETAFTQFKNAPASKKGQTCQDCHMGVTPGQVLPDAERYAPDGRDLNYRWEPAAKIKTSPRDPREGIPTPARKRTNHMFIGPDYSLVHPGIFPHNLEAREFTYRERFNATAMREITAYLDGLKTDKPKPEQREAAKEQGMMRAAEEAREHVLTDWLTFRWWEGWGTPEFEDDLPEPDRNVSLSGAGFPWEDKENPDEARLRRIRARLILDQQFNRLNTAHVERVRLLRRALQLESLEYLQNGNRGLAFRFKVRNATDGHGTPTGFDAERLMFLEVTLRDAKGRILFQSGDRDPNGDVRDLHSAYVHASARKEGPWLETSAWKTAAGLPLTREDRKWELDRHLFTLQTRFVTRNAFGGEREQVVPINYSVDPLPYVRPSPRSSHLTGRPATARKHQRTLPPLGHRWADYKVKDNALTGAKPYQLQARFISQMVPVNLVKDIASVGFDYNLSPREVAARIVRGHRVSPANEERQGGAQVLWDLTFAVPTDESTPTIDLTPDPTAIRTVNVASYPFPHSTEEDLKKRAESLQQPVIGTGDLNDLEFNPAGVILWPDGVPDGISLLPPEPRVPAVDSKKPAKAP